MLFLEPLMYVASVRNEGGHVCKEYGLKFYSCPKLLTKCTFKIYINSENWEDKKKKTHTRRYSISF